MSTPLDEPKINPGRGIAAIRQAFNAAGRSVADSVRRLNPPWRRLAMAGLPILATVFVVAASRLESAFQARRMAGWSFPDTPLGTRPIGSMAVDHEGRIWVGDAFNRIFRLDGQNWAPIYSGGGDFSEGWIAFDTGDRARVGIDPQTSYQPGVLSVFDGQSWTTYRSGTSGWIQNEGVRAVAVDRQDRTWVGMWEGLSILDRGTWTNFTKQNSGLLDNRVAAIAFDPAGRAWIGTWAGLSIFDGNTWTSYTDQDSGLAGKIQGPLVFDPSGRAWIATFGATSVFDGRNWVTYPVVADAIAFDQQGRAWLGTWGGLKVFEAGKFSTYNRLNSGLPHNMITHLVVDSLGRVWLSTHGGEHTLSLFDPAGHPPLSAGDVNARSFLYAPLAVRFLLVLMCGFWIAATLRVWPGVLLATTIGMLSLLPYLSATEGVYGGVYGISLSVWALNPGVLATVAGLVGGIVGGLVDKRAGRPKPRWGLILAVVGLLLGYLVGLIVMAIASLEYIL